MWSVQRSPAQQQSRLAFREEESVHLQCCSKDKNQCSNHNKQHKCTGPLVFECQCRLKLVFIDSIAGLVYLDIVSIQVVSAAPFNSADGGCLPTNHIYGTARFPGERI